MQVAFSTVVRSAPQDAGGEIVLLDWDRKEVLARAPVVASDPDFVDPNPRGNTRGGRGIAIREDGLWVASYHTLLHFDRGLRPIGRVSHPLFAGLHEVAAGPADELWVSSTALDAAIGVHLPSGEPVDDLHPRTVPAIAEAFGVQPLALDTSRDNRLLHLQRERADNAHHLHLNAVSVIDGDVHALFSRVGAVANLSRGTVVMRDPYLATAHPHNLVVGPDGRRYINDTNGTSVRVYRPDWSLERSFALREQPWVAALLRTIRRRNRVRSLTGRRANDSRSARPLFQRGLALVDERHVLVGISPATLLLVDTTTGALADHFTYDHDVHTAIHGLVTVPSD